MPGLVLNLNDTEGCTFIGILFSALLYGVTLAQTLYYGWNYPDDHVYFKALTAALLILDTAKESITIQIMYYVLIEGHGNVFSLLTMPITYGAEHALSATTFLVVEGFYIHNVWKLMENKRYRVPLMAAGVLLALTSYGGGWWVIYEVYRGANLTATEANVVIPGRVQAVLASAADLYIAGAMCFVLRESTTGFEQTQTTIVKLMTYAINRGLLLTAFQITLVVTACFPSTEIDQVFYFPLSSIYINSVLAVLNARRYLREAKNGAIHVKVMHPNNYSKAVSDGTADCDTTQLSQTFSSECAVIHIA